MRQKHILQASALTVSSVPAVAMGGVASLSFPLTYFHDSSGKVVSIIV